MINTTATSDTLLSVVGGNTSDGLSNASEEDHCTDSDGDVVGGQHCCFRLVEDLSLKEDV